MQRVYWYGRLEVFTGLLHQICELLRVYQNPESNPSKSHQKNVDEENDKIQFHNVGVFEEQFNLICYAIIGNNFDFLFTSPHNLPIGIKRSPHPTIIITITPNFSSDSWSNATNSDTLGFWFEKINQTIDRIWSSGICKVIKKPRFQLLIDDL